MRRFYTPILAAFALFAMLTAGCASNSVTDKKDPVANVVTKKDVVEPAKPVDTPNNAELAKTAEKARLAEQAKAAEQARLAELERQVAEAAKKKVEPLPVKPEPAATVAPIQFEIVYFDFDSSNLRQDSKDVLTKNAEAIIKSLPNAKIEVSGHCDDRGSAEYNIALGEHRAKSVQKYLTTLGVKSENLSTISYGKEKPAVTGDDEAAWSKNRRAEFSIIK